MKDISSIFQAIPDFKSIENLTIKNNIYHFIEINIKKLNFKLKDSPFQPCINNDSFGLNIDFGKALYLWLLQFPEKVRLPFLIASLSTIYISKNEFDCLMDIAYDQMIKDITFNELKYSTEEDSFSIFPKIKSKICPYDISPTDSLVTFIHKYQIERVKDKVKMPLKILIHTIKSHMYYIAMGLKEDLYLESALNEIQKIIKNFLNQYIVLFDDWTFSGATIKNQVNDLLIIMELIFSPFEKNLIQYGFSLPYFLILVPVSTTKSIKLINELGSGSFYKSKYYLGIYTGNTFDHNYSPIIGLPEAIKEFTSFYPKSKIIKRIKESSQLFFNDYFHTYIEKDVNINKDAFFNQQDFLFGYGNLGWLILTYQNSPNNSLPFLWFPIVGSVETKINALFPRVEPRKELSSPVLDEMMKIIIEKGQSFWQDRFKVIFEKLGII